MDIRFTKCYYVSEGSVMGFHLKTVDVLLRMIFDMLSNTNHFCIMCIHCLYFVFIYRMANTLAVCTMWVNFKDKLLHCTVTKEAVTEKNENESKKDNSNSKQAISQPRAPAVPGLLGRRYLDKMNADTVLCFGCR